jgi:ABC-2 type transport system permease protein
MTKALAIAGVNLRRVMRDRTGVFFIFVFPFLLILALGATYGAGFTPNLGVVSADSGPLGDEVVGELERTEGIEVRRYASETDLRRAIERGAVEGGLVIPPGYDDRVRAGDSVTLPYLARPTGAGQELRLTVQAAVDARDVLIVAARVAVAEGAAVDLDAGIAQASEALDHAPRVAVDVRTPGDGGPEVGGFRLSAAQQLIAFVFLTSLSASAMLIETRRLGVSRRMLASPTSARSILLGETLGRYGIALLQGGMIVIGTIVVFRVDWGNLLTTSIVIVLFALIASAAAMVMGSALSNAPQAGALGVFLGLVLAALGGCMVPLELFPPTMAAIAHLTPHAWAIDALGGSLARDAGPVEVGTELGALAAYAAGLLAVAVILLRRTLTGRAS